MLLIGVREEEGWLISRWNLTYSVGWEPICKAVRSLNDFYLDPQILVGDKPITISNSEDILKLSEDRSMIIRGISSILKVPIMITFYNQLNFVDVNVACATKEFETADYQKFNLSLGQFLDSIELAMYR